MTEPLDLTDIEARRDVAYADGSWDEPEWRDVIALLAEVKRLRAWIRDHELANGGCVPKPAYDELAAEYRVRLARYEAQEARIRAVVKHWEREAQADGEAAASAAATPPMRTRMHALSDAAREHGKQLLAALDEPEAPT